MALDLFCSIINICVTQCVVALFHAKLAVHYSYFTEYFPGRCLLAHFANFLTSSHSSKRSVVLYSVANELLNDTDAGNGPVVAAALPGPTC